VRTLVNALLVLIVLTMVACGQQLVRNLPDGVTCSEQAMANINENPPDERADPDSPEYEANYAMSYFRAVGCDAPAPSFEPLEP